MMNKGYYDDLITWCKWRCKNTMSFRCGEDKMWCVSPEYNHQWTSQDGCSKCAYSTEQYTIKQ